MKQADVLKIIKRNKLHFSTERAHSLLWIHCISIAYTRLLKKKIDFAHKAVVAVGQDNFLRFMQNEKYFGEQAGKYLKKNVENANKLFLCMNDIFKAYKRQYLTALRIKNKPYKSLRLITATYPDYFVSIGISNGFWRYLGNRSSRGIVNEKMVQKIISQRQKIAGLYPLVEKEISRLVKKIGQKNNFDGDLLRYMTWQEMQVYLDTKKISKDKLKRLRRRKQGYFLLQTPKQEFLTVDKKFIKKTSKQFFSLDKVVKEFKGYVAYPGIARGRVYKFPSKAKPPAKFILVSSITTAKELFLMKKCDAVVINEGGILSHTAIVAREMKKPCIIGTKIATQVLKDGDRIEVDANKGIVKKI